MTRTIAALLTMVAGLMMSAPVQAQIIVNGGFDNQPNFGSGISGDGSYSALTGRQMPGWTIEAGYAATVHNTGAYPFITGPYTVNMDGEGFNGHNANFYQDFGSLAATPYTIAFDWMVWQNNGGANLRVAITDTVTTASVYSGTFSFIDFALHQELAPFVGTGNTLRLRIDQAPESGINDNKFLVDNFAVNVVPEPGSMTLAAIAVAAVGGVVKRRRAEALRNSAGIR